MDVKLSLTGAKEIDAVLKGLPSQFTHKILQAAHTEAAKPFLYRAHLLAPVGRTGGLAESIGVVKTPFAKAGVIGEIMGGPRRGRFKGHAAHLQEFGTKDRRTKKRHWKFGYERGRVKPHPFITPAFESTKGEIEKNISNALEIKTKQFIKRFLKKYG